GFDVIVIVDGGEGDIGGGGTWGSHLSESVSRFALGLCRCPIASRLGIDGTKGEGADRL
ncbi:hypothetical protein U1Q18_041979, partial [Sarracenia purpurea var. burkii]